MVTSKNGSEVPSPSDGAMTNPIMQVKITGLYSNLMVNRSLNMMTRIRAATAIIAAMANSVV